MNNSLNELIDKELNISNTPFYKRKLFLIGMGCLLLLIIIIIIIIIVSIPKNLSFYSTSFIESKENILNPDQGFYSPIYITITPDNFQTKYETDNNLYHLRCDIS